MHYLPIRKKGSSYVTCCPRLTTYVLITGSLRCTDAQKISPNFFSFICLAVAALFSLVCAFILSNRIIMDTPGGRYQRRLGHPQRLIRRISWLSGSTCALLPVSFIMAVVETVYSMQLYPLVRYFSAWRSGDQPLCSLSAQYADMVSPQQP